MFNIEITDLSAEEMKDAPLSFKELCNVMSAEEALACCKRFGGLEFAVPAPERDKTRPSGFRGELRDTISEPSYDRFMWAYRDTIFFFPLLNDIKRRRRDRAIRQRIDAVYAEGKPLKPTIQQMAREYGIHQRHIYRIAKRSD